MKNVRVKVILWTCTKTYYFAIFDGRKRLFDYCRFMSWQTQEAAIRNAKVMAKRIGIPYDPEIIKQHGC